MAINDFKLEVDNIPTWAVFIPVLVAATVVTLAITYKILSRLCKCQRSDNMGEHIKSAFVLSISVYFYLWLVFSKLMDWVHWKWYIILIPIFLPHLVCKRPSH